VRYQGSTGSKDLDVSRTKVIEIYFELTKGLRPKGRKKPITFEDLIKSFLKYKKDGNFISSNTLVGYTRTTQFLLEWYKKHSKGRDINTFFSKNRYLSYCDFKRNYYKTHDNTLRYKKKGKMVIGRKFGEISNTTLNRDCRIMCSILRYGKEHMGLFKDYQIPSYNMYPEKRREDILLRDEYQKLKEYWMNKNPFYWYIISFVNNTGLRYPTELNNIKWSDVDFKQSVVMIRNRKNKNPHTTINTPVPLVGTSRKIIETLLSREGIDKSEDDFVFVDDNNKQVKSITRAFKKSLIECDIDKPLTMYSLRHLFITRMVKHGANLKVLSEVVGHTSTNMINKHYSHLSGEDYVKMFQEMEKIKQDILSKKRELEILQSNTNN